MKNISLLTQTVTSIGTQTRQDLLNKTVDGFCVHIAAKIASHTLRLLLRRRFGIKVFTFQSQPL